jgi:hypothetical protein
MERHASRSNDILNETGVQQQRLGKRTHGDNEQKTRRRGRVIVRRALEVSINI